MSLLLDRGGPPWPSPTLAGDDYLGGDEHRISGVMFGARMDFLKQVCGEETYYYVLSLLGPDTFQWARAPRADTLYPFRALVELDRAILRRCGAELPHILALLGAASAELGIARVYRELAQAELLWFLEGCARFHGRYGTFGTVRFEPTASGARMIYGAYPCYSPVYCASAIGFFAEVILRHGEVDPRVAHPRCHCTGDGVCVFELTWTATP